MNPPDSELIARVIVSDDRLAYGELVQRHQSAVRNFLRHLTRGDHAWADDLAQETFIKAHRSLRQFQGSSSWLTWLLGIAHNQFRNSRRRQREVAHEHVPEDALVEPSGNRSSDLRSDLTAAVRTLSPEEQAALHVCYHQGLSHHEAADVLAWPVGTLKTHLARSKEKLRHLLAVWNPQS